jgi:hypothetical protein
LGIKEGKAGGRSRQAGAGKDHGRVNKYGVGDVLARIVTTPSRTANSSTLDSNQGWLFQSGLQSAAYRRSVILGSQ